MDKVHIGFPKIEQFRSIVRDAPKERVAFTGTVKLHGTNASVVVTTQGVYAQSRERVITPDDDNYGFASWVYEKEELFFYPLISTFLEDEGEIVLYGEWCGAGIQKGVAIAQLPKMFVLVAARRDGVFLRRAEFESLISPVISMARLRGEPLYSIYEFQTYGITVDFTVPEAATTELREITEKVEAECPVAKFFGVSGVGEGVVWASDDYSSVFKVKGEKHSSSKVKTLAAVDTEKVNSILEFLDYALTENRLSQGAALISPDYDIKKLGDFLRWVYNDVVTEEGDTLEANGLDTKEIGKYLSARARQWYISHGAALDVKNI